MDEDGIKIVNVIDFLLQWKILSEKYKVHVHVNVATIATKKRKLSVRTCISYFMASNVYVVTQSIFDFSKILVRIILKLYFRIFLSSILVTILQLNYSLHPWTRFAPKNQKKKQEIRKKLYRNEIFLEKGLDKFGKL